MKISLITSTYNSQATLQDTFTSVRLQKECDVEYIVIDGNSSDGTKSIIEANRDIISKYVSEPDRGLYDAMNKGVKLASGDIVGFIHSDDMLASSSTLKRVQNAFLSVDTTAVYGDLQYVERTQTNKIVRYWKSSSFDPSAFYWGWMPPHPTFYLKRSAYAEYGLYDTEFRISADYELMLRMLLRHGLSAQYIPHVLVKMRVGGISNKSIKSRWTANQEDARAWARNGIRPHFWTRWVKPFSKLSQFVWKT